MSSNKVVTVIHSMRPPFLIITIISVLLGTATAYYETGVLNTSYLMFALAGAICAHMSVNLFNEYFDFKSGLDLLTERTPFNGGSGALPIVFGFTISAYTYGLFLLLAALLIIALAAQQQIPALSLLSLLALIPALKSLDMAHQYEGRVKTLVPAIALNVVTANLAPTILAATLWLLG